MVKLTKKHLLLSTLLSGAVMAAMAVPAYAQDSGADSDEIIVTGSRLNVNPNLQAAQPVLSISREEISSRGVVNIEDLTNTLPQISAAQTSEQSNGASGTSQLNLRGLGAQRTLSLIDGRRLPYGDSSSVAVNIDLVPTNLVERIEVLTGGSSAVYGSDAVAGVVNFILKDDFEGVELDLQYGFAQSSNRASDIFDDVLTAAQVPIPGGVTDGEEITGSITIGANLDNGRGNVVAFASYQNRQDIIGADRTGSACTLGGGSVNGFGCVGSSNFRRFNNITAFGATDFFQQEDGSFTPFAGGPNETFNFGASNFFQRPSERFQVYTKAHYEIAPGHELFADFGFTQSTSDAQIAPTASFGFFQRTINCDNPLLQDAVTADGRSIAQAVLLCTPNQIATGLNPDGTRALIGGITATHRNVEGGPRNSRLDNQALRFVGGARGTFAETWDYEVFGQFSATRDQGTTSNDFLIDNLAQSIDVVLDANGNAVCFDPSNGCVPYNIFQRGPGGESLVTQEALDFIQGTGITTGQTDQLVLGGNVQTDLSNYGLVSPFAEGTGVGFLLGVEYRIDDLNATPDQISQRADGGFTGVGGPTLPVAGRVDVFEIFGELEIPLITGAAFAEELVFNAQYRNSSYNVDGNGVTNSFSTDTFGLQLTWAPTTDIAFRGQFQRAVRAPNVVELFTGQSTGLPELTAIERAGLPDIFDPCSTANPIASAAACANTGVTAAQFGQIPDIISAQTQGLFGGNPNLTPESSDTFTIGAVFTPNFLDGFTASVDYFDISVDDAVVPGIGAQNIIDGCLETGEAVFCSLIQRDGAGSLNPSGPGIGFQLTNLNAASIATSGIDVQVNYLFDSGNGWGDFGLQYASTFLLSSDFTPFLGADTNECEGRFVGSCGQPTAAYRHRAIGTWDTPVEGLRANVIWRHFSSVENDANPDSVIEGTLPAVNYFDVSASWEFMEGITARAGVNNVFEQNFPVSISGGPATNGNNNTFPGIFDTGRFFFFGLNVRL